ncbi:MAG: dihydroorotase [Mangrovibacterium sp.]
MQTIIYNATLVNEGRQFKGGVIIADELILTVFEGEKPEGKYDSEINAEGKYLLPGVIDDQVHFREPGLTHKGDIHSESRAALAGGVTSYMEMPNTNPQATTLEELEKKYDRAAEVSAVNYSFYLGATNDNLHEVERMNPRDICGLKVFMGSSTGNMLVDKSQALADLFKHAPTIVTTHCEDEAIIRHNLETFRAKYGDNMPIGMHPHIRSAEACYKSSAQAVELAAKHGTRLHVLHLSSAKEMSLFQSGALRDKHITAEVCVHHLWFDESDYNKYGTRIKWNPAIKSAADKAELWRALHDNRIDVIATDHAPHTIEEKDNNYWQAPSGGPLVQHSLVAMLEMSSQHDFSIERIVEKMCHAPADLYRVKKRGYLRAGYYADLVLVNPQADWTVSEANIAYKCGWSPFEGTAFSHEVECVWVNGQLGYQLGEFKPTQGMRMKFER